MQTKVPNVLAVPLLAVLLAMANAIPASAQSKESMPESSLPKVGDTAPDFSMNYFDGNDLKQISLNQYRGKKNVVVAFFVFAFTGG